MLSVVYGGWFVSYCVAVFLLQNNASRLQTISEKNDTKNIQRRNNARRKDEITKSATPIDEKQSEKDGKTLRKLTAFKILIFVI